MSRDEVLSRVEFNDVVYLVGVGRWKSPFVWRVVPSSQCVFSSPLSSPTVLAGIVEASGIFVGVEAVTSDSDR